MVVLNNEYFHTKSYIADAGLIYYFFIIEKWTFKVKLEVYHRGKRDKKEAT